MVQIVSYDDVQTIPNSLACGPSPATTKTQRSSNIHAFVVALLSMEI
ncbi:MAG: hypothetical protein WKF36_08490 [Candidatus Nitrosocosmicus sp.]